MVKDLSKKTRGHWWLGWVKFQYRSLDGEWKESTRTVDWEFATIGQAHRSAEALAGSMHGLKDLVIVEVGASVVQGN